MAKEYNISKTSGACSNCESIMQPEDEYVAVVREVEEEFRREDYCLSCWDSEDKSPDAESPDVLGAWRTRVPLPQEKKKLFVDDELLVNFFRRLEDAEDAAKLTFRYVLALVLMRKRMLVYDRMERTDEGVEIWQMHFKGSDQVEKVIDPKMDEDKIAEVSGQLGQIMESEL